MFHKKVLIAAMAVATAAIMSVSFAGCKKKAASVQASDSERRGFNVTELEKRYKTGLAELVSAGTITKAQSEKIDSVLTERLSSMKKGGSRPSGSNGAWKASSGSASGSLGGGQPAALDGNNGPQSGTNSESGSRPRGNGGRFGSEMLQSLVKDGTITQAQAETVMQKLMGQTDGKQSSASSK